MTGLLSVRLRQTPKQVKISNFGLAAACRMMQLAQDAGRELNLCVVEKGSEVGAHIISGAVFEPTPLDELFPDWRELGTPVTTAVSLLIQLYVPLN